MQDKTKAQDLNYGVKGVLAGFGSCPGGAVLIIESRRHGEVYLAKTGLRPLLWILRRRLRLGFDRPLAVYAGWSQGHVLGFVCVQSVTAPFSAPYSSQFAHPPAALCRLPS